MVTQEIVGATPSESMPILRVGFSRRFFARVLDAVAILIAGVGIAFGIGGFLSHASSGVPIGNFSLVAFFIGSFFGFFIGIELAGLASALLEGLIGASVGKLLLGIRVRNTNGSKAAISQLLCRSLLFNVYIICFLLAVILHAQLLYTVGGIGWVIIFLGCFAMFGSSRQALHDMIAKTAVFRKKDLIGILNAQNPGNKSSLPSVLLLILALLVAGAVSYAAFNPSNTNTVGQDNSPMQEVSTQLNPSAVSTTTNNSATQTQVPPSQAQPVSQSAQGSSSSSVHPFKLLSVSPSSGPAGTSITVTGEGFNPNGNTVYFGNGTLGGIYDDYPTSYPSQHVSNTLDAFQAPTMLAACTADAPSCDFSQSSQDTPPGTYEIIVKNSLDAQGNYVPTGGQVSNTLTFTVTAQ